MLNKRKFENKNISNRLINHKLRLLIFWWKWASLCWFLIYLYLFFYQKNNNFYDNIIKVETSKSDFGNHVNQKPLKLMEFLISLVTKENAIILDPFSGSGTTCIAAKNINRHYIGIEIDSYNVEISNKRLLESVQLDLNIY